MPKFKLKRGGHTIGSGLDAKRYRVGEIFEAEGDLAKWDPNKFERIDDPREDYYSPKASTQAATVASREEHLRGDWEKAKLTTSATPPAQPTKDLQSMSAKDLQTYAAEEEIDLKGAKSKEEMLKVITAVRK